MGFNTADAGGITCFFTKDRVEKTLQLCYQAEAFMASGDTRFRLDFAQSSHGNGVWFVMIYKMLTGMGSGWRRCLQGVDTTARGSTMVSPGREGGNMAAAMRKHRKDNAVNIFCLQHLLKIKERSGEGSGRYDVSIAALRQILHRDIHASEVQGRITGDASGLGFSVINPDEGEALCIPMPKAMQGAIRKAGLLPKSHPMHLFIMAVAELAVCPIAQMQWGQKWRSSNFGLALFNTDNQNAWSWLKTLFANNELAQEICRPIATFSFTGEHTVRSLWWPTYANTIADFISRLLMKMEMKYQVCWRNLKRRMPSWCAPIEFWMSQNGTTEYSHLLTGWEASNTLSL